MARGRRQAIDRRRRLPLTSQPTLVGGLIADADGNLFGTAGVGTYRTGVAFEVTGAGFVVPVTFAGRPGKVGCSSRAP